jgi:rubrerythrin
LRMQSVSHLGQIEEAIEESSGNISIFFYAEEEVKYGLPIMPGSLENSQQKINELAHYSCIFCGYTEKLKPAAKHTCPTCKKWKWVKATNKKRVR